MVNRRIDDNIRIFRDERNDCYVVVKYGTTVSEPRDPKLYIFSPEEDFENAKNLGEECRGKINDCFQHRFRANVQPMQNAVFEKFLKRPEKSENRFVFALGYALCLEIYRDSNWVAQFQLGILKNNENTKIIRENIVRMLQSEKLPEGDVVNWKVGPNNEQQ